MVCVTRTEKRYQDYTGEAWGLYPNDSVERVKYVKKNAPSEIYNLFMIDNLRNELSKVYEDSITIEGKQLEAICNAFIIALENLEDSFQINKYDELIKLQENAVINILTKLRDMNKITLEQKKKTFYDSLYW